VVAEPTKEFGDETVLVAGSFVRWGEGARID
jgi:hypothetical protein